MNGSSSAQIYEQNIPETLWYDSHVDLKALFPTSYRLSIKRSFKWISIAAFAVGLQFWLFGAEKFLSPVTAYDRLRTLAVVSLVLIAIINFLIHEVQRAATQYGTDGFRLVITRGVIFKSEGSLPLLPVSEIFVRRDGQDLMFGLYEVNIATPVNATKAFGLISGLSYQSAHGMQAFLSAQLNKQISIASPKKEERI